MLTTAKDAAMPATTSLTRDAFPHTGNWTREQVMLAFALYCQTPFGKLHQRNPQIVVLAELIGRTPGALARKCLNLASLDPAIVASGRVGLQNHSHLDEEVWNEFRADWETHAVECEQLRQQLLRAQGKSSAAPRSVNDGFTLADYTGETRQAIVQQRVKQAFFRRAVLASYRGRCCVSGVSDPRLLIASHIVPWREDKANRLNPSNGLCLTAIHDKAFDQHLFTLTDDYRIVLSTQLKASKDTFIREVFWPIDGHSIELPERFRPDPTLMRDHRETMLRGER